MWCTRSLPHARPLRRFVALTRGGAFSPCVQGPGTGLQQQWVTGVLHVGPRCVSQCVHWCALGWQGIMASMNGSAQRRDPSAWVEDMQWHRRMFGQSYFRWVPEDPMALALSWTRGRVLHETPRHLRDLDTQLVALRDHAAGLEHAVPPLLAVARQRCSAVDYRAGLRLAGVTPRSLATMRFRSPARPAPHPDVERAVSGWPWPNPFSQVWELQQVRAMYRAAEDLLEDAFCDLVLELVPHHGWQHIAESTVYSNSVRGLQTRVEWQRDARGEPGDARRTPEQVYPEV